MKLKFTPTVKAKIASIGSTLVMLKFTGSLDFPMEFVDILRGLADEIEAQNQPKV